MILNKWRRWAKAHSGSSDRRRRKQAPKCSPRIELLEQRTAPSVVTTLLDEDDSRSGNPAGPDGVMSLREAIRYSNNHGGGPITFAVSGTIMVDGLNLGPLPAITVPVIIDGSHKIELAGSPGAADGLKILAGASGSTIKGMTINRFPGNGISLVSSNGNDIEGNFIGTNTAGTAPLGNGREGVFVVGSKNTIGGTTVAARNVISGNKGIGIDFYSNGGSGASENLVQGNYIGTDATGNVALGNGSGGVEVDGVDVDGDNNTIGGTAVGARNFISGNAGAGVHVENLRKANLVQGNYIGTDVTGATTTGTDGKPLGNGGDGVEVEGSGNTIGGTTDAARNVIGGNGRIGIYLNGPGMTGNLVQGNYIGTDATGNAALGNGSDGVRAFLGANNTIGGTIPGARNLISGNKANGVYLQNAGNLVQGNYIGTNFTGTAALGNDGDGVRIDGSQNTIGGTVAYARNIISGNKGSGVYIFLEQTSNNLVQGNYIGTDAMGATTTGTDGMPLGNSGDGVTVDGSRNTIGGTAGAGNVIAGNLKDGILITRIPANNNLVLK